MQIKPPPPKSNPVFALAYFLVQPSPSNFNFYKNIYTLGTTKRRHLSKCAVVSCSSPRTQAYHKFTTGPVLANLWQKRAGVKSFSVRRTQEYVETIQKKQASKAVLTNWSFICRDEGSPNGREFYLSARIQLTLSSGQMCRLLEHRKQLMLAPTTFSILDTQHPAHPVGEL